MSRRLAKKNTDETSARVSGGDINVARAALSGFLVVDRRGRDHDDAIWNPTLCGWRLQRQSRGGNSASCTAVVRSKRWTSKYRGNVNLKTFSVAIRCEAVSTTPFDTCVLNELDRVHSGRVSDRLPQLVSEGGVRPTKQDDPGKVMDHKQYVRRVIW